jgi:hypothetical protein
VCGNRRYLLETHGGDAVDGALEGVAVVVTHDAGLDEDALALAQGPVELAQGLAGLTVRESCGK